MVPKDPVILLSYINLKLRDYYSDLQELCKALDINEQELVTSLKSIDYEYDAVHNQFV